MLVLDENLPAGQRQLLRKWRVRFRVIGIDLSRRGTSDDDLIPVLHHLPQPTFFSLDRSSSGLSYCMPTMDWSGWTLTTTARPSSPGVSCDILSSIRAPSAWVSLRVCTVAE